MRGPRTPIACLIAALVPPGCTGLTAPLGALATGFVDESRF
jgi:hypothetical protein